MSITRREFLRASSVCALSAGLSLSIAEAALGQRRRVDAPPTGSAPMIPYQSQLDPVFQMSRETFTPYINSRFVIDPGYTFPLETTLIEVKDLRPNAAQKQNLPGKDCFSLTFRPTGEAAIKQGTYRITSDALGTFELFIVPVTNKAGDIFFEAIINRLVP